MPVSGSPEPSGAEPHQVIFTSGGTEASNQAVFGLAGREPGRMVGSAIEHSAVREPLLELGRRGFEVAWAPVGCDGVIDAAQFAELVRPGDRLAAAMWANNVTGVVQPVAELAAACREREVPLHTDAVQALAGGSLDFAGVGGRDDGALGAQGRRVRRASVRWSRAIPRGSRR